MTRCRSLAFHFVVSILANTASSTMWTVRCSACRWSVSGTTTTSTDDCGVSPGRSVHDFATRVARGDAVTHAKFYAYRGGNVEGGLSRAMDTVIAALAPWLSQRRVD